MDADRQSDATAEHVHERGIHFATELPEIPLLLRASVFSQLSFAQIIVRFRCVLNIRFLCYQTEKPDNKNFTVADHFSVTDKINTKITVGGGSATRVKVKPKQPGINYFFLSFFLSNLLVVIV